MLKNKIEAEDRTYDLNYEVSQFSDGSLEFSVSKLYCGNVVDKSMVRLMPLTLDDAEEMANTMCRCTVTPMSFREIVEEMILERVVVE